MVKQEFASKAIEGYSGFVGEQDLNLGNAFQGASGQAAYDQEMWNALHAANMLGDEASESSSIAFVQARAGDAGARGGANKDKNARAGQEFYNIIVLQRLREMQQDLADWANDLRQEQKAIEAQIDYLQELRDLVASGEYDQDDPRHAMIYKHAFPEAAQQDKADFDGMTTSERLNAVDDETATAQDKYDALGDQLDQLDAAIADLDGAIREGKPIANDGGSFTNPILEEARLKAGIEIDFDNLTEDNLLAMRDALTDTRSESLDTRFDQEAVNEDLFNNSYTATAATFSFDLG